MHLSMVVGLAVIPSKGVFRGGTSRCKVEEVDVLVMVEELVVHVSEKDLTHSMFPSAMVGELGVSATRVFGDGRCTWQT